MSLTCAGLSIRKYSAVVSLEDIGDNRCRGLLVNLILIARPVEYRIESELLGWLLDVGPAHEDLTDLFVHFNHDLVTLVDFVAAHGPATDAHFDTF